MRKCSCTVRHARRRVVFTGGPGAGKTAIVEFVHQMLCSHVRIVHEAASMLFSGGFPRGPVDDCTRAAQRAIYYVQRELETIADSFEPALVVCDRGTVDGLGYWPGPGSLWDSVGTTLEAELARYDVVIHLRPPDAMNGYDLSNPVRIESVEEAAQADARIDAAWKAHPRRFIIEATPDFLAKATAAIAIVKAELPDCACRIE